MQGLFEGAQATPIEEILKTGSGSFEQTIDIILLGLRRPMKAQGEYKAFGTYTLGSGEVLDRFKVTGTMKLPPPMPEARLAGSYYLDRETGIAIDGESEVQVGDLEPEVSNTAPARLIRPGEPGFDSTDPSLDCEHISLRFQESRSQHA